MRLLSFLIATLFVNPAYFGGLHWRLIGPFRGGRALAVTGVPGEPNHFYFGAVDGGVWESNDAGRTWKPIFDNENIASIGSIAVAPSNPRIIYVGSGEADMRSDIAYGNGMYRSDDGGRTWKHIGLADTRQIGAIVVDPRNPNVAYAAALGHAYGPNAERGVFKTTDGGVTWNKVLYKDENTGATALAMAPGDPNTIYAALWQTRRPPWNVYPPSNGPGSGLYKSTDAGATWTQLTRGLPQHVGRIGLSVTAAAAHRLYANVDTGAMPGGGIYRSDDDGATWTHTNGDTRVWQRGWYFSGITADPHDANTVYVMDTATYRSTDGGRTFDPILGDPTGDDFHTLWIDPADSNRMILGSDQGVGVSVNGAHTFSSWYNQPTGQFYHIATDRAFPFNVYGAQQDSGAAMSTTMSKYGALSQQNFQPLDVGGENGNLAPDPRHPGLVYGDSSGEGGPTVTREVPATGWEQNVDPILTHPAQVWRNTWTLPLAFSPADPKALYFGHQNVFRSRDGGNTWHIVSPDLSRANEAIPSNLDPTTAADNNGVRRHGVVYAIAPSPLRAQIVWAGTDDGYVWVSRDASTSATPHWHNVTPPALTAWSKVGIIEASHFDTSTAYIAVDRHRIEDYAPYIYRTRDGGATWTKLVNGIPDGSFVNVVREDPAQRGLLYAGTERGVYASFDDGASWQQLQLNLPVTSIRDIAVHGNDIAIATHGRAFWVMDDVSPLRQAAAAVAAGGDYLFAPSTAYRLAPGGQEGTPLQLDEPQSDNAPVGLYIDYYLRSGAHNAVDIDILDGNNAVVRHWSSAHPIESANPKTVPFTTHWITQHPVPNASAGAHRFVWDFHQSSSDGPLLPPGVYTVRLTVDGHTFTRSARVLRDPRIHATDADLRAQYVLATRIVALRHDVAAARERAQQLASRHSGDSRVAEFRRTVIGEPPADNPDDSMGAYPHDFTSFLFLENSLDYLESAVESGDAAPTADMQRGYTILDGIYRTTLAKADRW